MVPDHGFDLGDGDVVEMLHNLLVLREQLLLDRHVSQLLLELLIISLGSWMHRVQVIVILVGGLRTLLRLGWRHHLVARILQRFEALSVVLIVETLLGLILNRLLQKIDFSGILNGT